jgi:hypothetical protein
VNRADLLAKGCAGSKDEIVEVWDGQRWQRVKMGRREGVMFVRPDLLVELR